MHLMSSVYKYTDESLFQVRELYDENPKSTVAITVATNEMSSPTILQRYLYISIHEN